ncbi:SBBP repeat-containing protein [Hymenobacter sp. ASUV-10]|uniref:SBBP repeat-containing protein n=1 Tax=Hymenobacter aranciens TaxID=3063996 RepID=A0ABT9BC03_9BACT|nr:SBBP repeat-containing protein [Hymenobacter sp. ASUV-10]MDO7874557.1 SBBP repeat-containing protein [Hymenobacter sp. ASUV-10]
MSKSILSAGRWLWALLAIWSVLLAPPARAQGAFTRAERFGEGASGGWGQGNQLAVDSQGNTYVVGAFQGDLVFGSTQLTSRPNQPGTFLAKMSPAGSWLWAQAIGTSPNDELADVALDANDNVYVAGTLGAAGATFGSTVLPGGGAFVARLSAAGSWQWARQGTGGRSRSVAVNRAGTRVAVGGSVIVSATLGPTTLAATPTASAFVARLDGSGSWQGATLAGGTAATALAFDAADNVYLLGATPGLSAYPTATFGTISVPLSGQSNLLVAKLSTGGSWQWAVGSQCAYTCAGSALAVDANDNVVIAGHFAGSSVQLGSITLANSNPNNIAFLQPTNDMFVARLSPAGAWQWALKAGGRGTTTMGGIQKTDTQARGLTLDADANIYVAGYYYGYPAYFGPHMLSTTTGNSFVARLSAAGAWDWATNSGDYSQSIATGPGGTLSLTGYLSNDDATFRPLPLQLLGERDVLVAQLDTSGTFRRAGSATGFGESRLSAIGSDAAGNTYLTGYFKRTITLGAISLRSAGYSDVVVAKRDAAGRYLWAVRAGGQFDDRGRDVAVDAAGNVYFTGDFNSPTATFGPATLTTTSVPNSYTESNIVVAKLDPNGNWQWARQAGGNSYDSNDEGRSLAVDSRGDVYLTGFYSGTTAAFGPVVLAASPVGRKVFVAKISTAGTWRWAVRGGSTSSSPFDAGTAIAVAPNGTAYLTGYFSSPAAAFGPIALLNANNGTGSQGYTNDAFIARLDSAGTWEWAGSCGGPGADQGTGIALDTNGDLRVVGTFSGTATIGPVSLSCPSSNLFVAKIGANGAWDWVVKGGATSPATQYEADMGSDVALDPQNNAYVTTGVTSSQPVFGSFTLPPTIYGTLVLAVLDAAGNYTNVVSGGQYVLDGAGLLDRAGVALGRDNVVYVTGTTYGPTLTIGASTVPGSGTSGYSGFIAQLGTVLTSTQAPAGTAGSLWPNPAHGQVQIAGLPPGQPVQLLNTVGQLLTQAVMPAHGPLQLTLPAHLGPGLYLLRSASGGQVLRLMVE